MDIRTGFGRALLAAAALVFALASAGCDEKLSDLTGPTPNLEPTFSSIQREIFDTTDSSGRLACTNCHTTVGRNPSGGLNLVSGVSYANLVRVASTGKPGAVRVIPGDPDNSYIVHKLEGSADIVGVRMPRGNGPYLTDGQMLVIKRWIANGAPNN
ncbi:MAG TPA: hypothetical protein VKC35_10510 [Vicinamibacterales bacterium]|nr:hypothetical protein [Vicinamibacterales bacterium]